MKEDNHSNFLSSKFKSYFNFEEKISQLLLMILTSFWTWNFEEIHIFFRVQQCGGWSLRHLGNQLIILKVAVSIDMLGKPGATNILATGGIAYSYQAANMTTMWFSFLNTHPFPYLIYGIRKKFISKVSSLSFSWSCCVWHFA